MTRNVESLQKHNISKESRKLSHTPITMTINVETCEKICLEKYLYLAVYL
jgi:hypothetical protein